MCQKYILGFSAINSFPQNLLWFHCTFSFSKMYGELTKKQFWLLVFCAYGSMFGQGFIDNTRSVTYPLIRDDLHLSSKQYGMLQAMAQFSYLVWSLVTAMSLQTFGYNVIIVLAFLISILGCVGTAFVNNFWIMCYLKCS